MARRQGVRLVWSSAAANPGVLVLLLLVLAGVGKRKKGLSQGEEVGRRYWLCQC